LSDGLGIVTMLNVATALIVVAGLVVFRAFRPRPADFRFS
jgi:hypothetical protein